MLEKLGNSKNDVEFILIKPNDISRYITVYYFLKIKASIIKLN